MGLPIGHILDADTLALWRADEASGTTLADATGNFPLTASGAYDIVAGQVGNARKVDGAGAHATASIPDATLVLLNGSFTVEALVKIAWLGGAGVRFDAVSVYSVDTGENFALGVEGDGKVTVFETDNLQLFAAGSVPSGAFCHLALRCTLAAGVQTVDLFLNGALVGSASLFGAADFTTGGHFWLGSTDGSNNPFTAGTIDEVRISKVARTNAEILASYQRCFGTFVPATSLTHTTDHADAAVGRLLAQYKGKPLREGLLRALCTEVQAFEDAAFDVGVFRALGVAIGAQIDGIGEICGEGRQGRNDDDYRTAVQARLLLNRSSGTVPELVEIFATLLPNTALVLNEWFPAALTLRADGSVTNADLLAEILQEAKDGGVRAIFEYLATDAADTFTLGDSGSPVTSSTQGLGDSTNLSTGGQMAGAIE